MNPDIGKKEDGDGMERCAICGKKTDIPNDLPIGERDYYVECAGQLCGKCYEEIYGQQNNNIVQLLQRNTGRKI